MIRVHALLVGAFVSAASAGLAEQVPPTSRPQACPPGASKQPPKSDNPSDRLADSKGVICPPTVDPDIRVKPPSDDGTLKVVPAPGTPGGDPDTQPK
jgi:hypothetical protein